MNKHIIRTFLLLLTISIACPAFSQVKISNAQTDSLRQVLKNSKASDKTSVQLELALLIMGSDKHEAQILADSALSAARTSHNQNLEMRAYLVLGRINQLSDKKNLSEAYYDTALTITKTTGDNWNKGEILYHLGEIKHSYGEEIKALEYFNAALQACQASKNFKVMASTYSLMGTIFRVNGLYDRAIEYTINSKLNYEKAGMLEGKAWAAYLLGRIYADLKVSQKALEYFQEALEIYNNQAAVDGNQDGVAICSSQIGILYLDAGNFKEAHKYIDNTLKIYTASKSKYGLSNAYKNLGVIEYSIGNYELAEKYLSESLKIKKEVNDFLSFPSVYEYLGLCQIGKGLTEDGFKLLQQGLDLAIANNQKSIQLHIYSNLTEAYLKRNDFEKAMNCQKKQIEIQAFLLSGAANIKTEQSQAIYELDKKNQQILELEKQNQINSLIIRQHKLSQQIMIVGSLFALLISLIIYWFYRQIRQKNHALKETNAAKDKFFAIIAHDMRGPTGNLASFLEHLNDTFNEHSPEELKKILLMLYKSAENVSVLLENLLLWAQSQLNKIEFRPAELKLDDVLQTSIKGLMQMADNKQINIRYESDDQIYVVADSNMVQTIMRNLIGNAIKFTHRGGSVIIRSAAGDTNNALISITDNGVGIEKSALDKIFDLTSTLHTNGTEGEKSTGLGLILVKDFIERNKGTITIESQKDHGTVVSFTIPTTQRN